LTSHKKKSKRADGVLGDASVLETIDENSTASQNDPPEEVIPLVTLSESVLAEMVGIGIYRSYQEFVDEQDIPVHVKVALLASATQSNNTTACKTTFRFLKAVRNPQLEIVGLEWGRQPIAELTQRKITHYHRAKTLGARYVVLCGNDALYLPAFYEEETHVIMAPSKIFKCAPNAKFNSLAQRYLQMFPENLLNQLQAPYVHSAAMVEFNLASVAEAGTGVIDVAFLTGSFSEVVTKCLSSMDDTTVLSSERSFMLNIVSLSAGLELEERLELLGRVPHKFRVSLLGKMCLPLPLCPDRVTLYNSASSSDACTVTRIEDAEIGDLVYLSTVKHPMAAYKTLTGTTRVQTAMSVADKPLERKQSGKGKTIFVEKKDTAKCDVALFKSLVELLNNPEEEIESEDEEIVEWAEQRGFADDEGI